MPPAPAPTLVSMVTSQGQRRQPRLLETKGAPHPTGPGSLRSQGGPRSPGLAFLPRGPQAGNPPASAAWQGVTATPKAGQRPQRPPGPGPPGVQIGPLSPSRGSWPTRQALPTPQQKALPGAWYPPGAVGPHVCPPAQRPHHAPHFPVSPTAAGRADKTLAPAIQGRAYHTRRGC